MEKTIYASDYRLLLEWLRHQRKSQGLTMRDLAKRLKVHHSWIGRIEQGERRLDMVEFARLCTEIGCDPREGLKLIMPAFDRFDRLTAGETRLKKVADPRTPYPVRRSS